MVKVVVPYWRKIALTLGVFLFGAAALFLAYLAWYAQVHFFAYQDQVDAVLANLPPGEADPPALVTKAIHRVEGKSAVHVVARGLVAQIHDKPLRQIEWHIISALWSGLLPLRLDEREISALYSYFMIFEGGQGLAYGAGRYFDKTPADLNLGETLGLLAISRAPHANSPERRPQAYRRQLNRLHRDYRRADEPTTRDR